MGRRENGAMFHLAMLAAKHLAYEVSPGDQSLKVVDIESEIEMFLYQKSGVRYKRAEILRRRVDIVLRGQETSDGVGRKNTWVEVKSLRGGIEIT